MFDGGGGIGEGLFLSRKCRIRALVMSEGVDR